jgi:HSP20 family protein
MKAKLTKPETAMPVNKMPNAAAPMRRTADIEPLFGLTPFSMMRRFTDDFERMFDNFNAFNLMPRFEANLDFPRMTELEKAAWWPEIEVIEKKGELKVHADLPGMKKEDINVEFTDDALIISGERNQETEEERDGFYHSERNYGNFYRNIPIPEGADIGKANAVFNNGVLEITIALPKREPKARKLEVAEKVEKPPKAQAKAA